MKTPLIAVTNDDGIRSPGLRAAVEAVHDLGETIVMAPSEQQTATGRGLSVDRGEAFRRTTFDLNDTSVTAYHCRCTPAHAVLHGFDVLTGGRRPDLLMAGINYGENLGHNVTLSGTIGAALQGAAMGVPSLALSLQTDVRYHFEYGEVDWAGAKHFARLFARKMLECRLPDDVDVLKVDVPADATPETPWRVTRVAGQSYYLLRSEKLHPETRLDDREVVIEIDDESLTRDSDICAVARDRIVSVTPLSLDLTSRTDLSSLSSLLE